VEIKEKFVVMEHYWNITDSYYLKIITLILVFKRERLERR
jgi:hypothetical protein